MPTRGAAREQPIVTKPCVKCGASDRKSNGDCRPCAIARDAAYRAANKEKLRAYFATHYVKNADKKRARAREYAASNPEKNRARVLAWQIANPEKVNAKNAAWKAAHPETRRIHDNNRRARERATSGKLSKGLAEKLFKLQKGKCACGCKQPLGDDYHLDHIMPLALGGANTDNNIQLLRAKCNLQKNAKHPVEFMRQRGFLL